MKILALIAGFTSPFGDGIHEREIITRLCSTDDITVVTLSKPKMSLKNYAFKLYILPYLRPALFFNIFWGFMVGIILAIRSFFGRKIYDSIYIRDPSFCIGINMLKKFYRIPTIYKTVMFYSDEYFPKHNGFLSSFLSQTVSFIERIASSKSNKVIVPNSLFKKELIKRFNIDSNMVSVISVGVDFKAFSLEKDIIDDCHSYTIGYVGSLRSGNDIETLIKSVNKLKDKILNLHLVLVVNADLDILKKILKKYALNSIVSIQSVSHQAVPALLSQFSVVVVPRKSVSCTELVFPLKLLEAAAAKKPVLISKSKVISSTFCDKKNVLLFNPGDATDLSQKLFFLYTHHAYRLKLGTNLYTFCKEYDWQNIIEKLRTVLFIQ